VEPIPRHIIATAMLQNTRESGKTKSKNEILSSQLPSHVMNSLAPFQKDAVEFVVKNNGRAFICDEMGLGKSISCFNNTFYVA
jgi:hypothetical protein